MRPDIYKDAAELRKRIRWVGFDDNGKRVLVAQGDQWVPIDPVATAVLLEARQLLDRLPAETRPLAGGAERRPNVITIDLLNPRPDRAERTKIMTFISNAHTMFELAKELSIERNIPLPEAVQEVLSARDLLDAENKRLAELFNSKGSKNLPGSEPEPQL